MPGEPRTAGLQGTVLEGPAASHEHEPSTLTYMSLHEMPPPPDEVPPELEPEPEEDPLPPLEDDPPELPDPDEELTDASGETAGAQEPPCARQSSSQVST